MKKEILALLLTVLLISFVSGEIIFENGIKDVYNLGESIPVQITIKTNLDVSHNLKINLVCNKSEINFYTNGISLEKGKEKKIEALLVLTQKNIGNLKGDCQIRAVLDEDLAYSSNFKISNLLNIKGNLEKTEFKPKEAVSVKGTVTKENGEISEGFVEIFLSSNKAINQTGTVKEGKFELNFLLPSDLEAGDYELKINSYEKDSNNYVINKGEISYNISVIQIPTTVELSFEKREIFPNESVRVKATLYDQAKIEMNSTAFITIKDSNSKILEQAEMNTGEYLEYKIKTREPPSEWKVYVVSNHLNSESNFRIKEQKNIEVEITNETILITNTGNVFYNKTLLAKVGDESLNLNVELDIGKTKKYSINAPEGEYNVKVYPSNGEQITKTVSLTGNAVGIKEVSNIPLSNIGWILGIIIFCGAVFFFFKKFRKSFLGKVKMPVVKKQEKYKQMEIGENSKMTEKTGGKAELSLSIKGDKQEVSFVCLKIKNLNEVRSRKGSDSDTLNKIIELSENKKATFHQNNDYLFFIFAPIKTRTFKNENTALEFAETIQTVLKEHNRKFNQKIEFGVGLSKGVIIAKIEGGVFKFMNIDASVTLLKKIASVSEEEILLNEQMNDSLRMQVKTEKSIREGTPVYIIKEIKRENEQTKMFIQRFMERQKK